MKVCKQFIDIPDGVCRLVSEKDCFVPEMSLPIKDILAQFAFVDNIRMADMAKRGYEVASDDDDDFETADFDQMDLAEREELYDDSVKILNESKSRAKKEQSTKEQPTTPKE